VVNSSTTGSPFFNSSSPAGNSNLRAMMRITFSRGCREHHGANPHGEGSEIRPRARGGAPVSSLRPSPPDTR